MDGLSGILDTFWEDLQMMKNKLIYGKELYVGLKINQFK